MMMMMMMPIGPRTYLEKPTILVPGSWYYTYDDISCTCTWYQKSVNDVLRHDRVDCEDKPDSIAGFKEHRY